jgi:hypothetical protein
MHEPAASSSTASQIDQIDQILRSALMAIDRFEITHEPAASWTGNMYVAAEEGQGVSRCPGHLWYHRDDMIRGAPVPSFPVS